MDWELRHVEEVEAELDDSGTHVIINRIVTRRTEGDYVKEFYEVRADVMAGDEPLVSFQGSANAVRKHLMRWLREEWIPLSAEHASYIGYELLRAETTPGFVQD